MKDEANNSHKNKEEKKKEKQNLKLALYVFPAASIGALIGLLAYVKDWI